jgi:hypothetical protein
MLNDFKKQHAILFLLNLDVKIEKIKFLVGKSSN